MKQGLISTAKSNLCLYLFNKKLTFLIDLPKTGNIYWTKKIADIPNSIHATVARVSIAQNYKATE